MHNKRPRCVLMAIACKVPRSLINMRLMQFSIYLVLALAGLAACNPTFNWRDVRPDDTRLRLLMPCKPDKAQRTVPMGGQPTALMLLSCDAAGVSFAVAVADVKDASLVKDALVQWQAASLTSLKASLATKGTALS